MPFVDAAKNTMLDALTMNLLSLHTGHPGSGSTAEVTGGSPAYARVAGTIAAASGGTRSLSSDVTFNVPAGDVAVIGFWNSTGPVFHGWAPNGPASNNPQAAYAEATSDTINLDGHGLSNGMRVFVMPLADALPAGTAATTLYYVVGADADSFQLSLTSGGAAVDITADGDLVFQRCIVETYAQQGTHTVKAGVAAGL